RELELKNIYTLGGFQIDPKSFKLTLQSGQGAPPTVDLAGVPLIEMVGLDSWDEQNDQARRGHDGIVDQTGYSSRTRAWVDYNDGTLFLPDARPFGLRIAGAGARSVDQLLAGQV